MDIPIKPSGPGGRLGEAAAQLEAEIAETSQPKPQPMTKAPSYEDTHPVTEGLESLAKEAARRLGVDITSVGFDRESVDGLTRFAPPVQPPAINPMHGRAIQPPAQV